VLMRY